MSSKKISETNTVVWNLIPNQYEYTILLVLSNEPFGTLIPELNKKYELNYVEDKDFNINEKNSAPCCLINNDDRICALILNQFTNSIYDVATLSHEFIHIITAIGNNINLPINNNTTEAWAYFMSFYMNLCLSCLKEHLEEQKI